MRVVIDNNVIISAFITHGRVPWLVLETWKNGGFELAMSHEVLAELTEVLARAKHATSMAQDPSKLDAFLKQVSESAYFPGEIPVIPILKADPKDTEFLALAIAADVAYLVSGDKHLRVLVTYRGIPIVSPLDFIDLLAAANEESAIENDQE